MRDKSITPYNDKGQRHGLWKVCYFDGELWYKRFYQNNKPLGCEERYSTLVSDKLNKKKYYL
jgi:antitoxin component YwqK of YwqJK toxin-antitoxin module